MNGHNDQNDAPVKSVYTTEKGKQGASIALPRLGPASVLNLWRSFTTGIVSEMIKERKTTTQGDSALFDLCAAEGRLCRRLCYSLLLMWHCPN